MDLGLGELGGVEGVEIAVGWGVSKSKKTKEQQKKTIF